MAKKTGAGDKPQEYDKSTGRYGNGAKVDTRDSDFFTGEPKDSIRDKDFFAEPEKQKPLKGVIKSLRTYEGKPVGTYDYKTGKLVNLKDGYMVTFHQNEPDENGHYKSHYGRYTDEEYDEMASKFAEENDAEIFVGVFDDEPEISFKVKTQEQAERLAIENNQKSYWNNKKGREWQNKEHYDKTKNPMRGD